jgi:hypothetical protein
MPKKYELYRVFKELWLYGEFKDKSVLLMTGGIFS